MTSSFRCYGNTDVNQTFFWQVHAVSSKCVKQVAPPSSDSKVLAVQSWDGVPRKNPDEPPKHLCSTVLYFTKFSCCFVIRLLSKPGCLAGISPENVTTSKLPKKKLFTRTPMCKTKL